jgi:hypothetical protein
VSLEPIPVGKKAVTSHISPVDNKVRMCSVEAACYG